LLAKLVSIRDDLEMPVKKYELIRGKARTAWITNIWMHWSQNVENMASLVIVDITMAASVAPHMM
jgi:hypothetical protein